MPAYVEAITDATVLPAEFFVAHMLYAILFVSSFEPGCLHCILEILPL
jgi:hypothetical protein